MAPKSEEAEVASSKIEAATRTEEEVTRERNRRKTLQEDDADDKGSSQDYKVKIVWQNIFKFAVLHAFALAGILFLPRMSWKTIAFEVLCYYLSVLSVTAGAHRLWTHRAYKARSPLRFFYMVCNCIAAENSIYIWSRDHRVHHKFSETDADPHNSNRGFFFAHIGWLLCKKHPQVAKQGSKIDLTDLRRDRIVMFQHRFYVPLTVVISFVLPTLVPYLLWGEALFVAYCAAVLRYIVVLHVTWLVNSLAHLWGDKPYDVNIAPVENKVVSLLAVGEGFHNYHHTFPQDYSTSEWRYSFNFTTFFIDCMAVVGLAYDRKFVSKESLQRRIARTGPDSAKPENFQEEKGY